MTARRQVVLGLISACCCFVAVNAGGQTEPAASSSDTAASHVRAAERLLVVTGAEKLMQEQTEQMMQNQVRNNPAIGSSLSAMQPIIQKYASYAAVKPDLIKAYTAIYSESDLNRIIAFYQTDLGKMMLEGVPKVSALTQAAMAARMKAAQPELRETIRRSISAQFPDTGNSKHGPNYTYFSFQVSKPAVALDSSTTLAYPESLKASDVGAGQVTADFVVDTTGSILPRSVKITRSTNSVFAQAFHQDVAGMHFSPAEKDGRKVKQLVQMTFNFDPAR